METSKKWYLSKSVWGSIIMIVALIAQNFGLEIDQADQSAIVDYIYEIIMACGALLALFGRLKAKDKLEK